MHRYEMWTHRTPRAGPQKPSSQLSEAIYAGSCIRTSENYPSTHLGEWLSSVLRYVASLRLAHAKRSHSSGEPSFEARRSMYLGTPGESCSGSTPSSKEVTAPVPSSDALKERGVSKLPGRSLAGGSSYSASSAYSASRPPGINVFKRTSAYAGTPPPCS